MSSEFIYKEDGERLYSPAQAAERVGVGISTIYRAIDNGGLRWKKWITVGQTMFFEESVVDAYADELIRKRNERYNKSLDGKIAASALFVDNNVHVDEAQCLPEGEAKAKSSRSWVVNFWDSLAKAFMSGLGWRD